MKKRQPLTGGLTAIAAFVPMFWIFVINSSAVIAIQGKIYGASQVVGILFS